MKELICHFLDHLQYSPETGTFVWKERQTDGADWRIKTWNKRYAGTVCASRDKDGYVIITCKGKVIKAHRLVYLIETGALPNEIDHINGDKSDNRFSNLRAVTDSQNRWNSGKRPENKSGWKGVSWSKTRNKWHSQISVNKQKICLGYFDDVKEAAEEYIFAALKHHGEFARF